MVKTTKTRKTAEKPRKNKVLDRVHLFVNDQKFTAETSDFAEGLRSLIPFKICTKAIVVIESGNKTAEKVLMGARQARNIKNNKVSADLFIKHLIAGLK